MKVVEYDTSDFYFSAYLKSVGLDLVGSRKAENHNGLVFTLRGEIPVDAESLSVLYYSKQASVNVNAFVDAVRYFKSYINDGEGKNQLQE